MTCHSPSVISTAIESYTQQVAELTTPEQPVAAKEGVAPLKIERIKLDRVQALASDEKNGSHLCEALVSAHWPEKATSVLGKGFRLGAGTDKVALIRLDDGSLAHPIQFQFSKSKRGTYVMHIKPAERVVALFMKGLASSYYK